MHACSHVNQNTVDAQATDFEAEAPAAEETEKAQSSQEHLQGLSGSYDEVFENEDEELVRLKVDKTMASRLTDMELEAQTDGFDPSDAESMRAWRRFKAEQARKRMEARVSAGEAKVMPPGGVGDSAPVEAESTEEDTLVATSTVKPRPLSPETEETARSAISFIMKHRGGGPFGLGRLPVS